MISPFYLRIASDRTIDEYIKSIVRYEENSADPYNKAAAAYYGANSLTVRTDTDHPYNRTDRESLKKQITTPLKNLIRRCYMLLSKTEYNDHTGKPK